MAWKAAERKEWTKRVIRMFRDQNSKKVKNNLTEAIAEAKNSGIALSCNNEDGVVRVKLVVRKQELKQFLQVMESSKATKKDVRNKPLESAEQRLNLLRRKHLLRKREAEGRRTRVWCPELHSIPEEP